MKTNRQLALLLILFLSLALTGSITAQNVDVLDLRSVEHSFNVEDNGSHDLDLTSVYTIEFWVYFDSQTQFDKILHRGHGDFQSHLIIFTQDPSPSSAGQYRISFAINEDTVTTSNIALGEWHHIAISRDGTTARFYLDGTMIHSSTNTTFVLTPSNYRFTFGANAQDFGIFYTPFEWNEGAIDEFRYSDVARYTGPSNGITSNTLVFTDDANTVLLFHFDDDAIPPTNSSSNYTFTIALPSVNAIDAGDYKAYTDPSFSGTDLALPVELSSFLANGGNGTVTLSWITQSELDNQGFYLYRAEEKAGTYEQISDLIKGAGNSSTEHFYSHVDEPVYNGTTYWYKLVDVDYNGLVTEHPVISAVPHIAPSELSTTNIANTPVKFKLKPNFPNPFNPETNISFDIPGSVKDRLHVSLFIYNMLGQKVRTLIDEALGANTYTTKWDGKDDRGNSVPSGLYFSFLKSNDFVSSHKMVLVR